MPQQQQQQPRQQGGVLGPGLTMGQSTNAATAGGATVPGVRIDLSNIKGTTRFGDLDQSLQTEIIAIDAMIQRCMDHKAQVDAFMPAHGEQVAAIPGDVKLLTRRRDTVEQALDSDVQSVRAVQALVTRDANSARLSFAAVDNLKLPPQYHHPSAGTAADKTSGNNAADGTAPDTDPLADLYNTDDNDAGDRSIVGFFERNAGELASNLDVYESRLAEVEAHMRGLEAAAVARMRDRAAAALQRQRIGGADGGGDGGDDADGNEPGTGGAAGGGSTGNTLHELAEVLRDFEHGMLRIAGSVQQVQEQVATLKMSRWYGQGQAYLARQRGEQLQGYY